MSTNDFAVSITLLVVACADCRRRGCPRHRPNVSNTRPLGDGALHQSRRSQQHIL